MAKVSFHALPLSKTNVLIKIYAYLLRRNFLRNIKNSGNLCPLRRRAVLGLQTSTESV